MSVLIDIIGGVGPAWGWLAFFGWGTYQLYWPFSQTKLQHFRDDFTGRLKRIEVTQVALSEELDGVDEGTIKELHGQEELSTADLKG